jgi:transaldolase
MTANPCVLLGQFGQSLWLDYIQRSLITSGALKKMITQDGLKGMTSNPSIFEKAIVESHDYDETIRKLVNEGKNVDEIYQTLSQQDVQMAADEFRPVYERTDGVDGMVSIEVNPHLAHDTDGTIEEARRLWKEINRPNIFVKVPATLQGLPAIEQLISEGININVTLLFGLGRYKEVAAAFLAGLQRRAERGLPLKNIASVASFFLSRIDVLLDPVLESLIKQGGEKAELAKKLHGRIAIASAKIAYQIYKELFSPEKFKPFFDKGARTQRLLWASTSTKNPAYSDVKFGEALIGPNTVNTVPVETFNKYKDHGKPALTLEQDVDQAFWIFEQLPKVSIAIDKATQQLEDEGVQKFIEPFDKLMDSLKTAVKRHEA